MYLVTSTTSQNMQQFTVHAGCSGSTKSTWTLGNTSRWRTFCGYADAERSFDLHTVKSELAVHVKTPCIHTKTANQWKYDVHIDLCELADGGEAVRQRLVGGEAVSLHGVGGLWGAVARLQVRRVGSRQTSRVEHGLRLRTSLSRLRGKTDSHETVWDKETPKIDQIMNRDSWCLLVLWRKLFLPLTSHNLFVFVLLSPASGFLVS